MARPLPPIVYGKMTVGGLLVRPDSREVMIKAIEGRTVEVGQGNDYINLYHIFERLVAGNKEWSGLKLMRQQVGRSKWILYVLPEGSRIPETPLEDNYDPKRGRYKRYAEQLAAGEMIKLEDKAEAIKARRAWQLYIPGEKRRRLKANIRKVAKTGKYEVRILSNNG